MVQILHITPHLGGGIGKVLSELVKQSIKTKDVNNIEHKIICLEQPEKLHFIDEISKNVIICPSFKEQEKLINESDIIQIELFDSHGKNKGNSSTVKYLKNSYSPLNNLKTRTIVWYHNNGLYDEFLTNDIINKCNIFLFTSPCSYESKNLIQKLKPKIKENNLDCVFASGGFDNIPKISTDYKETIFGCFKQLNSTKLHPNIDMYLDHKNNIMVYEKFVPDIIKELMEINVIIYLLNPKHFGCSENLLLECMAMGIVPIVFNNPAERCIVENNKTGLIINNIKEFEQAIEFLHKHPIERQKLGLNAAKSVRERFSIEITENKLNYHYNKLMKIDKQITNFNHE